MKINGIELEFDFYDADQMEVFENALNKAEKEIQEALNKGGKQSEMIRNVCQATIYMLDDIFGEGTSKDVFGSETNFKKCIAVFRELVEERAKQEDELGEEVESLTNSLKERYGEQQPNRAIRRASRKS